MADGVVVYDRTGQTRRMNAALRTLMGIAGQSDLASRPFRERLARYDARDEHGIPLPLEQWPVDRLLQGEVLTGSHTMDLLLQTVDGRQIQVNFSGAPIRDARGQVVGAVTIARDVTERRQLEREATTRARELEAIFEAIADGIIVYDLQGTIVQMNAATRSLLGFTLHPEAAARPAAQRLERYLPRTADGQPLPPEHWPLQRLLNGEVLTGANTVDMQIQTPDGRSVLLNISGAPVRDESGHLNRLVTITRDVTEHRRLQREAVERASELQAIFEAMADAVIVCDRQGAPVHMNSAYRRLLDGARPPQDPVSLPFEQALPAVPRDEQGHLLAAAQWPLSRLLQGETLTGTQTTDLHIRSRTGRHLHLNASGAPVYDARGQLSRVVLLLRDVSARHHMEEQTRKSLHALLAVAEALVDDPREGTMQEDPLSAMTRTLAEQIGHLTRSVLDCRHVGLLAWDPRTDVLRPLAVIGLSPQQECLFCKTVAGRHLHDLLGDPSLVGRLQAGETLSLDLTLPSWQWMSRLSEVHAAWLVPMRLRGQAVGVLCLTYRQAAVVPSTQAFALAEAIANLVALVLERERLLQERAAAQAHVRTLARTDAITGLLNHRALLAQLSEELEQAQRKQLSCCVLVIDLDHFKAINDGYGHVVGDAVLVAFAQLIGAHLPALSTVGFLGKRKRQDEPIWYDRKNVEAFAVAGGPSCLTRTHYRNGEKPCQWPFQP